MATRFLTAEMIVEELKLYGSVTAVHRAAKKGEIPPPVRYGKPHMWREDQLLTWHDKRQGESK
jgi:hypothetical protein